MTSNRNIVHPNVHLNGQPMTVTDAYELGSMPGDTTRATVQLFETYPDRDLVDADGVQLMHPNDPDNMDEAGLDFDDIDPAAWEAHQARRRLNDEFACHMLGKL